MRKMIFLGALLFCAAAACGTARAADVAFPAGAPGEHARAFFAAYNAGEPEMRAFYAAHFSAEDLVARPPEARLGVWRHMRENQGTLTPVAVLGADFVEVRVRNAQGDALLMRLNCHDDPPHQLMGVTLRPDEGGSAPVGPPLTDAQVAAALAAQLDSLARADAFSGVVSLEKDGVPLFAQPYGMASREAHAPNTLDTHFGVGSINKMFTHIATLQLAHAGKLALTDPIGTYLPDFPKDAGAKITIDMLIHHTSGIGDVLEVPALWKDPAAIRTEADWYRIIRDQPLRFEPGAREEYSNGGFVVLGMIVERASGEDYHDYIRRHVYAPAGMTETDHYTRGHLPPNTAVPYTRHGEDGHDLEEPQARPNPFGRASSAGGGYSTAADMLRFAHALRQGTLLDAEANDRLVGPHPALGIAGGNPGVNAVFEMDGPYTLVVLANADPPAAERIARDAMRLVRRAAGESEGAGTKIIRAGRH